MKIRLTSCVPFQRKRSALSSTHQETLRSATSTSSNTLNIAVDMRNEILSLLANSMASLSNASHEELYIYISPSMNSSETSLHVGAGESNQRETEKQGVLREKNDWVTKGFCCFTNGGNFVIIETTVWWIDWEKRHEECIRSISSSQSLSIIFGCLFTYKHINQDKYSQDKHIETHL